MGENRVGPAKVIKTGLLREYRVPVEIMHIYHGPLTFGEMIQSIRQLEAA